MHTQSTSARSNPSNSANALSPILREHLRLVAPPTPTEERALADAIVAVRRDAWVAVLSDPARSPDALRTILGAEDQDSPLARVAEGLPYLQWLDACARAARSRPASVARSYVPGMANVLAAVLADRAVDPTDDALAAATAALHVDPKTGKPRRQAGPHAARARVLLARLADRVRDLAARNLRLVAAMARAAHWSHTGDEAATSLSVEDLISHGVDGLARGIRGYDPALGYRLSTYMGAWIRASIGRAIANFGRAIRIPTGLAETMRKAVRTARELAASIGREPTPEEVAVAIGCPGPAGVATVRRVLGGEVPRVAASLDQPLAGARGSDHSGEDGCDFLSRIASDAVNPEEALIAAEEHASAERLIARLAPRERKVIALRYGLGDGTDGEVNLKEIGLGLDLTRERVRQIHDKAIVRMRRAATARPAELRPSYHLTAATSSRNASHDSASTSSRGLGAVLVMATTLVGRMAFHGDRVCGLAMPTSSTHACKSSASMSCDPAVPSSASIFCSAEIARL